MNIIEKLKEQVNSNPLKKVIFTPNNTINFQELDEITDKIAAQIYDEFFDYDFVPVISRFDEDYILCMLAIWKIGKTYVPINLDLPNERIKKILNKIHTDKILVSDTINIHGSFTQVIINKNYTTKTIQSKSKISNIAYVLMTSGTTGEPKAVKISQASISWFMSTISSIINFSENDKFLITTPAQFDVSFHEMLSFIYGKGSVVTIYGQNAIDKLKQIPQYLSNNNISHIALSPSVCDLIIKLINKYNIPQKLKYILLAGESLKKNTVKNIFSILKVPFIYNLYGPTETTIYATYKKLNKNDKEISIGIALPGVKVKIKNNNLEGEILIGGAGVALGYFEDEEETKNKFHKIYDTVYYFTGDIGKRYGEEIIYLYRNDEQIKINGIRIEISDIENSISKIIDNTIQLKVIYYDKKIILFYEGKENYFNPYKPQIEESLPEYMIPKFWIPIKQFKLTPNRKIDNNFLKNKFKEYIQLQQKTNSVNPMNKEEINKIQKIIRDILNINVNAYTDISIDANSINQIEIIVSLEKLFGISLENNFLKLYRTPKSILHGIIVQRKKQIHTQCNVQVKLDYFIHNLKLNSLIIGEHLTCEHNTYYIQKAYISDNFHEILVEELSLSYNINPNKVSDAITNLIKRHSLLASQITYKHGKLIFKIISDKYLNHDYQYHLMITSQSSTNINQNIIQYMEQHYLDHILWFCYFDEFQNKLIFFINHLICDLSSLNIIVNDFYLLLEGHDTTVLENDYFSFIDYIDSFKDLKWLTVILDLGFAEVTTKNIFNYKYEQTPYFSLPCKYCNTIDIIKYGNYIISSLLIESQKIDSISGSTILDLRIIGNKNYNGVVGDIHTTIPIFKSKIDTNKNFSDRFDKIQKIFEMGNNINNIIYFDYPIIPDDFKQFELFLDDNLKFSSNYLGGIKSNEYQKNIDAILKVKSKLNNFSIKKLYISFFKHGNQLVFIPLTDNVIDLQSSTFMFNNNLL